MARKLWHYVGYIADVFSGRIALWTERNNVVVTELWNKAGGLSSPAKEIIQQFIVSASAVPEALFLRSEGPSFVRGNLKKMSVSRFHQLYCVLLTYFVFIFRARNPEMGEKIRSALLSVVQDKKLAEDFDSWFVVASLPGQESKFQLSRATHLAWERVVRITDAGDVENPGQFAWFGVITSDLYRQALRQEPTPEDFLEQGDGKSSPSR